MSSVYVLEPPTKGKVTLNTTHGPVDIELWPKEAPKAVRNFVQLCLEGYYDNTIFHRIIKGFMVQGGDPTGSGFGGESIYGSVFPDEFHSRLRFNHRGLVACANTGSPHSNGSQFFLTLDRCDWLDKKNTIFGKVTGDSIFNLLRLGDVETDKNDRPLDTPPKILSIEVLWNPFDDIAPRVVSKKLSQASTDAEHRDTKKKSVKKLNLLSFGEEAEDEEKELAEVKQKIKSSHDVLDDPRLLKDGNPSEEMKSSEEVKKARDLQLSVREVLSSKKEQLQKDSLAEFPTSFNHGDGDGGGGDDDDDDDMSFDARMRLQILNKRKELGDLPTKQKSQNGLNARDQEMSAPRSSPESLDDRPKMEKLSIKKKGIGSEARAERMVSADSDLQLFGNAERERLLQKQKKRRLQGREDDVLAKLEKFKKTFAAKPVASLGESEGGDNEDLSDWRSHRLKFAPESGKDKMSRNEDPNDYVVHDPLLEKGKEKFNRMVAKQKRREREWAGRSLT
ncbi:cytochrome P450 monooxygenase 57 [Ancistrocladus abbreviatus]